MADRQILIVDDKEENRYLLRALLQGHGYEVDAAIHGADALDQARQKTPALIIADILMPVMDGFALCRAWKKDENLKAIPFIFYTATYTDERDREFALRLGADRFIVKPAEPDHLLAIIREVLQPAESTPTMPTGLPPQEPKEESIYLKQYNETLIRKMESKMEELERANNQLMQGIAERKEAQEMIHKLNEELEQKVQERTAELKKTISQLEELNRVFVGREMKMAELKARIAELEKISS